MEPRRLLLVLSGGIAAYKIPELVRRLKRGGHAVRCAVTPAAREFVSPLVLQTLSGEAVRESLFDGVEEGRIDHVALADWAEAVIVAPATANLLAKLAAGLADDLVTTLLLATRAPLLVAPAMNVNMWSHPATRANVATLRERGVRFVGPEAGELACGWEGEGRMAEPETIHGALELLVGRPSLAGERVVVSAGGTREPVDAVRVLANRSSGKMGFAIAEEAARRGAETLLVAAPSSLPTPPGVRRVDVETALEMREAVRAEAANAGVVIMAAAVADFRPAAAPSRKIKKEDLAEGEGLTLELVRNPDILAELCQEKGEAGERILVGFAAESHDVVAAARRKLERKGCDLIVANDVSRVDAGFESDSNAVIFVSPGGEAESLPLLPKAEVARRLLDRVEKLRGRALVSAARRVRGLLAVSLALVGLALLASAEETPVTRQGHLNVARIAGSINPASSDYLQKAIAQSEEEGAAALLIELDTPGGLVASTKDIIQAMLNAEVPIIVYVAPQGAWAGSAGTFITMAAHVAAMAPGSSIGAAHPVGIGGGGGKPPGGEEDEGGGRDYAAEKAENLLSAYIESIAKERGRNVEWASQAVRESKAITADEAVELRVVDLVAVDRADLLRQVEGRTVKLKGQPVVLSLAGARQETLEMPLMTRVLNVITDPNVAVLLLMAGLLGLYIEFNQPGVLIPGILGAVCLILAMIAMQILPFSWVGLLLILLGIGLFAAEVFVTSYGLLFAAGVVCFLVGGSMIFDRPELSDLSVSFWSVLVPAVGSLALFAGLVVFAVARTLRRGQVAGVDELIGMLGVAKTPIDPEGTVFIRGEHWRARSEQGIAAQERVEAVAVEGLELTVRRAPPRA